jgi:flagellar biosynthesis chaperone FliJ
MVRAQMLSELEEIIAFKQYADQPERQQTMRKTWMKRYVSNQIFGHLVECCLDFKAASLT